jgi:hypothetical protein
MMFDLGFSEEFFMGEGYDYCVLPPKTELPTSVLQALVSMHPKDWAVYCRTVLDVEPDAEAALPMAMRQVRRVNSCTSLTPPVEVLIGEGWALLVYDKAEL